MLQSENMTLWPIKDSREALSYMINIYPQIFNTFRLKILITYSLESYKQTQRPLFSKSIKELFIIYSIELFQSEINEHTICSNSNVWNLLENF